MDNLITKKIKSKRKKERLLRKNKKVQKYLINRYPSGDNKEETIAYYKKTMKSYEKMDGKV